MSIKLPESMWCGHCDHEWETENYYTCESCPNCTKEPVKIYRTNSFAFVYAHMAKNPQHYHPTVTGQKCVEYCDWPRCLEPGCLRKKEST